MHVFSIRILFCRACTIMWIFNMWCHILSHQSNIQMILGFKLMETSNSKVDIIKTNTYRQYCTWGKQEELYPLCESQGRWSPSLPGESWHWKDATTVTGQTGQQRGSLTRNGKVLTVAPSRRALPAEAQEFCHQLVSSPTLGDHFHPCYQRI